jgi:hypothetical protein
VWRCRPGRRRAGSQTRAELLAARVELVAEDRCRRRRVDESRRDQVHAYGCELERKALRQRGQRSGDRGDERAGARATPSGAADEQQTPARSDSQRPPTAKSSIRTGQRASQGIDPPESFARILSALARTSL